MVGSSVIIKGEGDKFETYKNLLEQILSQIKTIENNITEYKGNWTENQLFVVKSEIEELHHYAKSGEIYFKYGKKQRMLESTYCVTESLFNLNSTNLGRLIGNLQDLYDNM